MRSSSRVGNILAVLVLADADPVFGTLASSVDDHVSVLMAVYSSAHLLGRSETDGGSAQSR